MNRSGIVSRQNSVAPVDPEVFVDHVRNLPTAKENGFSFLCLLFLQADSFFSSKKIWMGFCSALKQSSHQVLQKFGIEIPLIDDEDLKIIH